MELEKLNYYRLERSLDNKLLIVTLNRPPANAFNIESYEELLSIINYIDSNKSIHVVVLRAEGKLFSGGADINAIKNDSETRALKRRMYLRIVASELRKCSVPVVISINGAAVGAGAILAACGDIIVAAENAYFSLPEIDVGVIGGAKYLSRILPMRKVRSIALTGERVPVKEAYNYGGIDAVVEADKLDERSEEHTSELQSRGHLVCRLLLEKKK